MSPGFETDAEESNSRDSLWNTTQFIIESTIEKKKKQKKEAQWEKGREKNSLDGRTLVG